MSDVDATEQLKTVAARVISDPGQLAAFLAVADANRCADADGNIDVEKVGAQLRTLFAVDEQPQQPGRQWGQSSGQPAGVRAGDTARAALERRHGGTVRAPDAPQHPGDTARAALQKRYPVKRNGRTR